MVKHNRDSFGNFVYSPEELADQQAEASRLWAEMGSCARKHIISLCIGREVDEEIGDEYDEYLRTIITAARKVPLAILLTVACETPMLMKFLNVVDQHTSMEDIKEEVTTMIEKISVLPTDMLIKVYQNINNIYVCVDNIPSGANLTISLIQMEFEKRNISY